MNQRLLIPNVAAEEGSAWRGLGRLPAVQHLVRAWRLLFSPDHQLAPDVPHEAALAWPSGLGPRPEGPVFAWLDSEDLASAWLNTEEAVAIAADSGVALAGAPPDVVARVHDKSFAHSVARDEGLAPTSLRDLIHAFDPGELIAADAAARIRSQVAGWPEWLGGRFSLKPRFGGSGRGRFGASLDEMDPDALQAALARLAQRGGAMLEPWLERDEDLSVQLWVDPAGDVLVLGSLTQNVSASGVYRGHRGIVDVRGRVRSGSDWDEPLREAAVQVALAARDAGFQGPCSVDAFSFRDENGALALRPVVELNARFTTGTVALGLVRRALGEVGPRLGLAPGALLAFDFDLEPAEPQPGAPDTLRISLAPTEGSAGPTLGFAPVAASP